MARPRWVKIRRSSPATIIDSPTREAARRFVDVIINVADGNTARIFLDCVRVADSQIVFCAESVQLKKLARCLTGWRIDDDLGEWEDGIEKTGNFIYHKPWHDRFNKLVLGKYIEADQPDMKDGMDVLDLLANHPGTAKHIARKLCRRFISDVPNQVNIPFHRARCAGPVLAQVVKLLDAHPHCFCHLDSTNR